ncbi:MAG TPA: type II toxin-antitoxin system RelE/ParE family toxin [Thermoanaerobaculia bacterium]|nr:type II toxin-antitoxin system RelE/ParE family toxin [Thermoanaerobaculia bacterium]
MIRSFRDKEARKVFERKGSRKFGGQLERQALRKLLVLDAAESLDDLRVPPGNRLEKLQHDRVGQRSIRINDQWRICFRWSDGDAYDVEITDYH